MNLSALYVMIFLALLALGTALLALHVLFGVLSQHAVPLRGADERLGLFYVCFTFLAAGLARPAARQPVRP